MANITNQEAEFHFERDGFYLELQLDSNKISFPADGAIESHPFPGLRPFKTSEFILFKGLEKSAIFHFVKV